MLFGCAKIKSQLKNFIFKDRLERARHDKHGDLLARFNTVITVLLLAEIFLPARSSRSFLVKRGRRSRGSGNRRRG